MREYEENRALVSFQKTSGSYPATFTRRERESTTESTAGGTMQFLWCPALVVEGVARWCGDGTKILKWLSERLDKTLAGGASYQ